jgi:hypothetical protein
MAKSKRIRVRVGPRRKYSAERIPNAATRKALHEAGSRRNIESFESFRAWVKKMRLA